MRYINESGISKLMNWCVTILVLVASDSYLFLVAPSQTAETLESHIINTDFTSKSAG